MKIEALKLLHVSRNHLNTLANAGALGAVHRTAGNHRRISKAVLLDYRVRSEQRLVKSFDAIKEASQKLGLYDGELTGIPCPIDCCAWRNAVHRPRGKWLCHAALKIYRRIKFV